MGGGLKQSRGEQRNIKFLLNFNPEFQVRGAKIMCIPLLTVSMRSALKFDSMWFGFDVVCAVILELVNGMWVQRLFGSFIIIG